MTDVSFLLKNNIKTKNFFFFYLLESFSANISRIGFSLRTPRAWFYGELPLRGSKETDTDLIPKFKVFDSQGKREEINVLKL